MPEAAGADAIIAGLGRLASELRARGAGVGIGEFVRAHKALAAVDAGSRTQSYLALRASLCSGRADLAHFDAAFSAVFGSEPGSEPPPSQPPLDPVARVALPSVAVPSRPLLTPLTDEIELRSAAWSDVELLRHKDFASYSEAERRAARAMIGRLAARGPTRRSRRTRVSRRRSREPDHRATARTALRHAGEPLERRWREQRHRPRQLVLVCDVSGSMEPYARMLLQYMQACVAARRRAEAFAFGTRLTRVTEELGGRDPDQAMERAADALEDFAGGTRIGAALAELNRAHGRRIGRGAIVVILSDGWDRGDAEQMRTEIARLARCSHRLVWLNPLKADPAYQPLTRGIRTALPHIDLFLAGNSLASLEELAALMEDGIEERHGVGA